MSLKQPSLGYIYVWSESPEHALLCLLGDKAAQPTSGGNSYGGWEKVKRRRNRSLTEWAGNDGLALNIPIMIDNFAIGTTIEPQITELERMAGRLRPGAPDHEPPLVSFNASGAVPHDYHREPTLDWVIEDIEWGDCDRNSAGNRVRQAATIIMAEYVEDDDLASMTSAQRRRKSKAKNSKKKGKGQRSAKKPRYVVRNGDTLESIAAKELGRASRWHDIKALNPKFRDPTKPIPAGTILNMP